MINQNNPAMQEINLSNDRIISHKKVINGDFKVGIELNNGKKLYVVMVDSPSGGAYALIDPESLVQHGTICYESLDHLFKTFPTMCNQPVNNWYAFENSYELSNWLYGESEGFIFIIAFDESKIELDNINQDAVVALKISGVAHFLTRLGSESMHLINPVTNQSINVYSGDLTNTLKEIKREYHDVEAWACINTLVMYGWIIEINQRGVYELT